MHTPATRGALPPPFSSSPRAPPPVYLRIVPQRSQRYPAARPDRWKPKSASTLGHEQPLCKAPKAGGYFRRHILQSPRPGTSGAVASAWPTGSESTPPLCGQISLSKMKIQSCHRCLNPVMVPQNLQDKFSFFIALRFVSQSWSGLHRPENHGCNFLIHFFHLTWEKIISVSLKS